MQPSTARPILPMTSQDINGGSADDALRAQLSLAINPHSHAAYGSDANNIDPQISSQSPGPSQGSMMMGGDAHQHGNAPGAEDGDGGPGSKKRELSSSKRAAQNRQAQRAFRQRKEGYIKKLEEQVRQLHALEESYKTVQGENYSLREYIIHLQSRLLETQNDIPQPPPNVNLSHPRQDPLEHLHRQTENQNAPLAASDISQLQASAAQAVAGLGNSKADDNYITSSSEKRYMEIPTTTPENNSELNRLQAVPDSLPALTNL